MKKILILLLSISMLLTACGADNSPRDYAAGGEQDTNVSKGRYAEEKIDFLQEVRTLFDVKKKGNGVVQVAFESEPGSLYFFESTDFGKTWQSSLEIAAGELPEGYRAADAVIREDGNIIVSAGEMSADVVADKRPIGIYEYYMVNAEDGSAELLTLALPEADGPYIDYGYGLRNLEVSEDNFLYATLEIREEEGSQYAIYCFDLSNGQQEWSKKTAQEDFSLYGDSIYLNESGQGGSDKERLIKTLDAHTGEETENRVVPMEIFFIKAVDFDRENQRMYFATREGIFSGDDKLSLQEKLVDGNASSLGEKGYHVHSLYMLSEKVFLVFMQDNAGGAMRTLRYEYNAELSLRPDGQMVVYSLKQNDVIEKMVFDFAQKNPDISVKYEVGMEGTNITSVTDAINILNTEIMAGNGPDVIVLNGLPWQSYSEKGILLDLKQEIDAITGKEKLFTNLFSPYEEANTQYAIPVSFKIPVVLGQQEVQKINSLDELVDVAEQSGAVIPFYRADKNLLRYIASVCWNSVQEGDNISEEGLKKLLEQTKKLNDCLKKYDTGMDFGDMGEDKQVAVFEVDTVLDTFVVSDRATKMGLNYLSYINNYVDIYNYNLAIGHVSPNVFSPLLVGISAKTTQEDSAKQFLDFALGEEEQAIFAGNAYPIMMNFPVNRNAFQNMTQKPSDADLQEMGKVYQALGMEYKWPDEAYFNQLEMMIAELSVPAMEDTVVIDTVLESAWPYMNGEKDIETTVNEITQKLELYFAE